MGKVITLHRIIELDFLCEQFGPEAFAAHQEQVPPPVAGFKRVRVDTNTNECFVDGRPMTHVVARYHDEPFPVPLPAAPKESAP